MMTPGTLGMPLDASLRAMIFRVLINFHLPTLTGRGTHYGNILKNTLESAQPHSDCARNLSPRIQSPSEKSNGT